MEINFLFLQSLQKYTTIRMFFLGSLLSSERTVCMSVTLELKFWWFHYKPASATMTALTLNTNHELPHGPLTSQDLLSMGFSRQEYWSQLPVPPLGDLPDPGIKPASPAGGPCIGRWILYHWATWESLPTSRGYLICWSHALKSM